MASKYYWTTGPISSSLGLKKIKIEVLNNSNVTRIVTIDVYDLSSGTPIIMYTKKHYVKANANKSIAVDANQSTLWEVLAAGNSRNIRIWVGGQDDGGMNLIGNVVFSSQMQLL